jgi:hypothetical protein
LCFLPMTWCCIIHTLYIVRCIWYNIIHIWCCIYIQRTGSCKKPDEGVFMYLSCLKMKFSKINHANVLKLLNDSLYNVFTVTYDVEYAKRLMPQISSFRVSIVLDNNYASTFYSLHLIFQNTFINTFSTFLKYFHQRYLSNRLTIFQWTVNDIPKDFYRI